MVVVVVRVVVGVVVGVVVVVVMERAVVVTSAPVAGPMSSHYGKTERSSPRYTSGTESAVVVVAGLISDDTVTGERLFG